MHVNKSFFLFKEDAGMSRKSFVVQFTVTVTHRLGPHMLVLAQQRIELSMQTAI
jgi:hypothetical protein